MSPGTEPSEGESPGANGRGWVEMTLWAIAAESLLINWFNGPAVSNDQAVIRAIVIVGALLGAGWLRLHARKLG